MMRNLLESLCRLHPVLFVWLSFCVLTAEAAQEFKAKDGDTITIKISSRELTRITVDGAGRIQDVLSAEGLLDIQPDKSSGEIFIRPMASAPPTLSFFVKDDQGATYTIVAKQYDIPSETVIIKPAVKRGVSDARGGARYRSPLLVESVKRLMKGMALGAETAGYSIDEIDEAESEVPLWAETEINLKRVYSGYDLVGEIYTIKNISEADINFHEREFLDFGDRVQAVALERLSLLKGESTYFYVVRTPAETD